MRLARGARPHTPVAGLCPQSRWSFLLWTALGSELFAQPFDAETHQRSGREQVTYSLSDQAADPAARIERQLADDRERILVADRPLIRKGAKRRGGVVVKDVSPDDPAALPNGDHMMCHPLLRTIHQGFGVVQDRQPVQRRTEQQDLSVRPGELRQGGARPEAVMPRLIFG